MILLGVNDFSTMARKTKLQHANGERRRRKRMENAIVSDDDDYDGCTDN